MASLSQIVQNKILADCDVDAPMWLSWGRRFQGDLNGMELIIMARPTEELEAIRLKDLEGFEQEECADRMQVSRPTFQRILLSAR